MEREFKLEYFSILFCVNTNVLEETNNKQHLRRWDGWFHIYKRWRCRLRWRWRWRWRRRQCYFGNRKMKTTSSAAEYWCPYIIWITRSRLIVVSSPTGANTEWCWVCTSVTPNIDFFLSNDDSVLFFPCEILYVRCTKVRLKLEHFSCSILLTCRASYI